MEIFKDVKGYEGLYQVSNHGRVKSLSNNKTRKERILKHSINQRGYKQVILHENGLSKCFRIHQLVAFMFFNHVFKGYEAVINHKDLDQLNNNVSNLEIIPQRENANMKHIKSSSIYTGVSWDKSLNKWRSRITINRKQVSLGAHRNEIDAANAYKSALSKLNN